MDRHDSIAVIHGNDGELDLKTQISGNLQAYEEIGFEGDISNMYMNCTDYSQYEELLFDGCDNEFSIYMFQDCKVEKLNLDNTQSNNQHQQDLEDANASRDYYP